MRVKITGINKEKIIEAISNGEIDFVDSKADLILKDVTTSKTIAGRVSNEIRLVEIEDIIYFEANGNDVYAITNYYQLKLTERLHELENEYFDKGFIRISKSYIVNRNSVEAIIPSLNRKFILKLLNGQKLEVTRFYYNDFKKNIGL